MSMYSVRTATHKRLVKYVSDRVIGPYRGLPTPLYALFLATVVNGIGVFVFPFMTLLLTRRYGLDGKAAGDLVFLTTVAWVPGSLIGGKLSDHIGRKPVQMIAQVLSAALLVPCGFIRDPWLVAGFIIAAVFFDGVTDPARQAMVTDLTTPENRQSAFSLIYLGHNLGFGLGQMIAGFLFASATAWMFWGNAIAIAASLVVVGLWVPESTPDAEALKASATTDSAERAHDGGLLSALASRPTLVAFALLTALYGFGYAQHRFTLPLQASVLFGDGGARLYGFAMTMNAVMVLVFTTVVVSVTGRWRPIMSVALAGLLYAAGFGMLAFAWLPWMFFASTFLWTMGEIVQATSESVYVSNNTPMSHRGRFNAVLPLLAGMGFSLSSPVAGRMIGDAATLGTDATQSGASIVARGAGIPSGMVNVWVLVALLCVIAAAGLWLIGRKEKLPAVDSGNVGAA